MRAIIVPASELSPSDIHYWSAISATNPLYSHPTLRPELFKTLGKHYDGAFVGILEDGGRPTVFFPFAADRYGARHVRPIPLTDYQAFIGADRLPISISDLLRQWNIVSWTFEQLVGSAEIIEQTTAPEARTSYRVNMPCGFQSYMTDMHSVGKTFSNTLTKLRKLERDCGNVRFVADCRDPAVLTQILKWKAQRFWNGDNAAPWVRATLDDIWASREGKYSGLLSALYAGDELIAAHFGTRTDNSLFFWFGAFSPEYSRYTPGWLLLYFMLRELDNMNCATLELGPGGQYKDYFANESITVYKGHFDARFGAKFFRSAYGSAVNIAKANNIIRGVLGALKSKHQQKAAA
jgi:CelD/BcsL family acetyltransferase involved in cellulose biosynthesis